MSEDIIRIDGVEYELREGTHMGCFLEHLRPKRKQTGWICRHPYCTATCIKVSDKPDLPTHCLAYGMDDTPVWEPFYGKVVE